MQTKLMEPFQASKLNQAEFDMKILVWAAALKAKLKPSHGISRCLVKVNGEHKKPLKRSQIAYPWFPRCRA